MACRTVEDCEDLDTEQQAYNDMVSDLQSGECVTVNEKDEVFFCGKHLGRIGKDFSEKFVWFVIGKEMDAAQFWPNIYRINDHGNVSLLNSKGNEVKSWV